MQRIVTIVILILAAIVGIFVMRKIEPESWKGYTVYVIFVIIAYAVVTGSYQ